MSKKKQNWCAGIIWTVAVLVLFSLLLRVFCDVTIVNMTGLVRGTTQTVVAAELCEQGDRALIEEVDVLVDDVNEFAEQYWFVDLNREEIQVQWALSCEIWESMKAEFSLLEQGQGDAMALYALSQAHFTAIDAMISDLEYIANVQLLRFAVTFLSCVGFAVLAVFFSYRYHEKRLKESIAHDPLTGLFSVRGFEAVVSERLHVAWERKYLMVYFDLQQFKLLNKRYGYQNGDMLLCEIAKAISRLDDGAVICSRVSADTFVVFGVLRDDFLIELDARLQAMMRRLELQNGWSKMEFIYGAYELVDNTEYAPSALDKASLAHRYAKEKPEVSSVYYNDKLLTRLKNDEVYLERLPEALQQQEFKLYMQPKIDLDSMKIVGAESLVRWCLPDGTLIYPDEFISLFEVRCVIAELDFYMLERSCEYLAALSEETRAKFSIAVNISRITLYQANFLKKFIATVDGYGVARSCIEVEVTETALNELGNEVVQLLVALRDAGFSIAIDDFGAGYSSLSFLSKIPVHILKLDRQFLWEMDKSEKMSRIMETMVSMAHKIGALVVCEGVETKENVTFLQNIGCDYAQGYHFARPMPVEEFLRNYHAEG